MNRPSYYDILGLTTTANKDEIKSSFRRLAQRYHPDKNAFSKADDTLFIIINSAYQVLINDKRKNEYDLYLNKVKGKRYSPVSTFRKHDPLIEKTLSEFNYILWDIEDIIHNLTEEEIKIQTDGKTFYIQIIDFFRNIEEEMLKENDRYKNFINKKIEKRNIETYFYLLRIEIQKHIENLTKEKIELEIEQLVNLKTIMISFISDMIGHLKKMETSNH